MGMSGYLHTHRNQDMEADAKSQCILHFWRHIALVLILTEEFAVDLGSFFSCAGESWPSLVTSNWCIPVKNTLGWSAVVFCAWEVIQLFSIVFCVVTAVHKFDFRLVINEAPNKWRPVDTRSYNYKDSCFDQDLYIFPTTVSSRVLRDYIRCAGQGQ